MRSPWLRSVKRVDPQARGRAWLCNGCEPRSPRRHARSCLAWSFAPWHTARRSVSVRHWRRDGPLQNAILIHRGHGATCTKGTHFGIVASRAMSVIGIGPVAICSSTLYRQPTVAWWPAHASGARADLTVERHRIIISANFEARHGANGLVGEQGECFSHHIHFQRRGELCSSN